MAKYAVTEKMVTAAWLVLMEEASPPYSVDVNQFTDEQIKAGELKQADEEAEEMNQTLMRRALEAAFDLISQEPKKEINEETHEDSRA